jgi:uncharacterized protein (TIGR00290 family)
MIYYTKGVKEDELKDLEEAIKKAVEDYKIEGIVTGAVCSNYQESRIKNIADKLRIKCINPLWQKNQIDLLKEIVDKKFKVIICGVFAYGLENFIGREINKEFVEEIEILNKKYKISPVGEGGEFESFVLNAPFFKYKLIIKKNHVIKDSNYSKTLIIDEINLEKN